MELGLTFDTGALIALERRHQRMSTVFRRATQRGLRITVPTPVLTEWWRCGATKVAKDILASVDVEPLREELAKLAGEALARTRGSNAIDAIVVASAAQRGDIVYTSDVDDLLLLASHFRSVRVLGT